MDEYRPRDTIRMQRVDFHTDIEPEVASRLSTIPPPPMPEGSVSACCPHCGCVFAHDPNADPGDDALLALDSDALDDDNAA